MTSERAQVEQRTNYIDGKWVPPASGEYFDDFNPFTGEVVATVASSARADAAAAVAAAAEAFPKWAAVPPAEKQRLLLRTADLVERRAGDIRRVLAEETGGGAAFADFQLSWIVKQLRQAAGWVYLPSGQVIPSDMPGSMHMAVRRPLGVVAGFSPWNGKVGDPRDPDTIIGPLIHADALERVKHDVADAVAKGARIVVGGEAEGPCFQPTVLTDVPESAHIYREETFGPVLVVQPVDTVEDAIRVANDHAYGLSAGVLTRDADKGLAMPAELESGMVRVNDQTLNDEPQMPLGGTRDSGWGRQGPYAVEDFTQLQWVSVQSGRRPFPF